MAAPKHGVYIIPHKKWNTKKIFHSGNLMATYRYQPKQILFQHPMVNDKNQDLAGGWTPLDFDEDRHETVGDLLWERLEKNLKPMGFLMADSKGEAKEMARTITERNPNLVAKVLPKGQFIWDTVAVAQKGTLRDVFDDEGLDALYRDYVENNVLDGDRLAAQMDRYADRTLISFAQNKDWDIEHGAPPWLTGLLLGYPVENTISLYLEGRVLP